MTAYNIVSPGALVSGQSEDISVVLSNLQAIQAILNGGIDNTNINAAAAIAYSKLALANAIKLNADIDPATSLAIARLAGYPADVTKALLGDGTWGAVGGMTKLYDSGALGASAASIDSGAGGFSTAFTHLHIIARLRTDQTGANALVRVRFNNDSGSNYNETNSGGATGTSIVLGQSGASSFFAQSTAPADVISTTIVEVPFYSVATFRKAVTAFTTGANLYDNVNPTNSKTDYGTYIPTTAITRVQFLPFAGNFVAGSRVMIYGIA